eukprot:TRINITY_DN7755_c0_g5_i1.p1 TRINITY_DN7755_c0_g5~~TRINITY_DN7755_c0_g5_i1.p1  ORF type:complete len:568 (-),score=49.20 TRINITY_DN7755_c0_g5_i1:220-1731(-)
MESWAQDSNRINKALQDNSNAYSLVQSKSVENELLYSSSSLVWSRSPAPSPVLEEQQNRDRKQTLDGRQKSAVISTPTHLQRSIITSQELGTSSNQIESRSKDKQDLEQSVGKNYANKDAVGNSVACKPNLEVSNFLSMLKSSSDINMGINLDAKMVSVPPPPGFGPPGFTTPLRTTRKDPNPQQTSIPQAAQAQQSNPIVSVHAQRSQLKEVSQPAPSKYNSNPLGVIGNSRLVSDVKDSYLPEKLYGQRGKPAVPLLGGSSGGILTQLQALWKDEGIVLGGSSNTSNLSLNHGIGRDFNGQSTSLYSGGLWAPMATSSSMSSSSWQQQSLLVSNGLNFGLDTESGMKGLTNQNVVSNKNSLLWGAMQLQRNGFRQEYPTVVDSFISGNQFTNMAKKNNNPLQGVTYNFMNQPILDNGRNNSLSNQPLLQGNSQLTNNLGIASLGQNGRAGVLQSSLQQQSQQTHDLNVLLQQLQQGGNRSHGGGGGSDSGNDGFVQNFPTV